MISRAPIVNPVLSLWFERLSLLLPWDVGSHRSWACPRAGVWQVLGDLMTRVNMSFIAGTQVPRDPVTAWYLPPNFHRKSWAEHTWTSGGSQLPASASTLSSEVTSFLKWSLSSGWKCGLVFFVQSLLRYCFVDLSSLLGVR